MIKIPERRSNMSKLTRSMINDYHNKRRKYNISLDAIKNIFKPLIEEKRKDIHVQGMSWKITGVEFCNDEYMDDMPREDIWVEISEDEYNEKYYNNNWGKYPISNYKEEYIYEPEYQEKFYEKQHKKYEYVRVYVHESWSYGGFDDVHYDILLSEILDVKDLRSEKLKKINENTIK